MLAYVSEYGPANRFSHEPRRPRKLLVHRRQLERLLGQVRREGYTLVPLSIYFNERGMAKLELGLAKGKRKADRRAESRCREYPMRR